MRLDRKAVRSGQARILGYYGSREPTGSASLRSTGWFGTTAIQTAFWLKRPVCGLQPAAGSPISRRGRPERSASDRKRFSQVDGMVWDDCDTNGILAEEAGVWIATSRGLSHFTPRPAREKRFRSEALLSGRRDGLGRLRYKRHSG